MRTRPWCVVVALVSACAVSNAGAQSLPLTEADALARLSPTSPRVRAITSGIDVARADVLAAGRWPNPRVIFDRESVAGVSENMAMISQALPITGRRGINMKAASALVDASTTRADDALRRARADLRLAFAQLAAAQVRERELSASLERLSELAEVLAKREAAGDAAGFDRLRAERELLDVETDRAAAATERARAQSALAAFFADAIDPRAIAAVDIATTRPALPEVDALVSRAESMRGELLALRHEVDAAHLSGRAADRRRWPEPELVIGTKSSTAAGGDIGSVITVQASVPLFDRNHPERALAQARASQAEARAEVFRIAIRAEISALRAVVIERRQTAERYRRTSESSAGQMERIAQVSYDAGERGILELLDAFRSASAARVRLAALDAAARQAEIELEFVSGWEIP
jgi:cobalt-zinc-cadmium efflux system outer membrane protein